MAKRRSSGARQRRRKKWSEWEAAFAELTSPDRGTRAGQLRHEEQLIRHFHAELQTAEDKNRAKIRRRLELAIERFRILKHGSVQLDGVETINTGGRKLVGGSTTAHRTHEPRFRKPRRRS